MVSYWLKRDYSWELGRRYPEWVYKNIRRGVLIEELLLGADRQPPHDYNFFVLKGKWRLSNTTRIVSWSTKHP